MQTVRYGGQELRLIEPRGSLSLVREGRTLVAASDVYGAGVLQVFSLPEGVRRVGQAVALWAVSDKHVIVVPRDLPSRVDVLALADLAMVRRFDAHAQVVALVHDPVRERIVLALATGELLRLDADGRCLVLARTDGPISLAISADGERVAVGTARGMVEVVWVQAVRVLTTLWGGHSPVNQVAFTPDTTKVVAITGHSARWWPIAGGQSRVFEVGTGTLSLEGFTRSGAAITASHGSRVAVHDLSRNRLLWHARVDGPCAVDGDRIWVTRLQELSVHEASSGKVLYGTQAPGPVRALAAVPGQPRAIVSLTSGTALRTVDLAAGVWAGGHSGHEGPVVTVAFGPQGQFVTGGLDGRTCTWSLDDPSPTLTALAGPTEAVTALALDPQREGTWVGAGQSVAFVGEGGETIRKSRPLGADVRLVFPIHQTRSVLVCTEASARRKGSLLLLDATTLEPSHQEWVTRTYTRARRLASGHVRLQSGRAHALFEPFRRQWVDEEATDSAGPWSLGPLEPPNDQPREVHWSMDGTRMVEVANCRDASGALVGRIFLTELPAGWVLIDGLQTVALSGKAGLSRSGLVLATPHVDGHVRVWDLARGECIADWNVGVQLEAVFVFPDEWRVLGAAGDGQLFGLGAD